MALTNVNIADIIAKDKCVNEVFSGVFPVCCLPRTLVHKPATFIVNLDEHYKGGSHWVALNFRSNHEVEYFDSYGLPPSKADIILFLERNTKYKWIYNDIRYQGDLSVVCGHYCVMYVLMAARGLKLSDFHHLFNPTNFKMNDNSVTRFLNISLSTKCKAI